MIRLAGVTMILLLIMGRVEAQEDLSNLYDKVHKAVVTIYSSTQEISNRGSRKGTVTIEGLGSGFLISDRQVVTAAHVVQVADNIIVEFSDKEKISASVISLYKNADVALLELAYAKRNATTVVLGNSDDMKIGTKVFVIGAPYGLQHSFSAGYLSGRISGPGQVSNAFTRLEFFQTDAAINTGNSGGPMFNMKGEVVGVVSYILSQSGGFDGLGFAATSNVAKELLLERNPFYLGFDGVSITGDVAGIFNLPQSSGFLVQKVLFLSPAGMMGLKGGEYKGSIEGQEIILGGDIILEIEGIEFSVQNLDAISVKFNDLKKGDKFSMKIFRKGKIMNLNGTI